MIHILLMALLAVGFSFLYRLINTNPWMLFLWIPLAILTSLILYLLCIYFLLIPYCFKGSRKSKFRRFLTYTLADMVLFFINAHIEVIGQEKLTKEDNVLHVANHKSLLDPIYLYRAMKNTATPAIKSDIWTDMKYLIPILKAANVITIDRNNDRNSVKEIIRGINLLKDNKPVLIFPEGGIKTRETERMVAIKAGAYKLAVKGNAIIQPYAIHNNSLIDTRKKFFKHVKVVVEILDPIRPSEYEGMTTLEIGKLVLERVNARYDSSDLDIEIEE